MIVVALKHRYVIIKATIKDEVKEVALRISVPIVRIGKKSIREICAKLQNS